MLHDCGYWGWWDDADSADDHLNRKLLQLHDDRKRKEQLRELRLYDLARSAVPWKSAAQGNPPSDELAFLAEHIIEGDTWGTFMAFSESWRRRGWQTNQLERYLPWVPGLAENNLDDDGSSIEDKLQVIQEATEFIKVKGSELQPALNTHLTRTERCLADADREGLAQAISTLSDEFYTLKDVGQRQQRLAYIIIGSLICLLLMRWL